MDEFVSGGAGESIRRRIMIPETIRMLNKKCNFAAPAVKTLHNREEASSGDGLDAILV
jgi:hypothetical protein